MGQELVEKHTLSAQDIDEIKALAASCEVWDGFEVKLNWEMMSSRNPSEVCDFCYYQNGQLVGYVSVDGFGSEYELSGLVLPAYRTQGIFRQLVTRAISQLVKRPVKSLLLVAYSA